MNKTPIVSIIMGSTSDLPIMEKACQFLNDMQIPFEVNALSAHRTPDAVEAFAKGAKSKGIRVIIAGAGMAAALPGVIAASTTLPVKEAYWMEWTPSTAFCRCLPEFLWQQ